MVQPGASAKTSLNLSLRPKDFIFLQFLPLLGAVFFYFFLSAEGLRFEQKSFLYVIIIVFLFDTTHVVASYEFLRINQDVRRRLGFYIWFLPLSILAIAYVLYFIKPAYYFRAAGYTILFHTTMQQYAWFKKSITKRLTAIDFNAYRALFFSCALIPILYWHTGQSALGQKYFYDSVIAVIFPRAWASALIVAHIVILVGASFFLALRRKIFVTAFMVLTSTWCIYFVGIILSHDLNYFWIALVVTHAVSYYFYTFKVSKDKLSGSNPYIKSVSYILFFSGLWFVAEAKLDSISLLAPLLLLPNMLHCVFDSLIWRKKTREFLFFSFQKSVE